MGLEIKSRCPPLSLPPEEPLYLSMLKNPEYFLRAKKMRAEVVHMDPMTFLKLCWELHMRYVERKAPFDEYIRRVINMDLVREYAEKMRRGERFPIPVLDYVAETQEGRHRAYAAMLAGCREIPVLVVLPAE